VNVIGHEAVRNDCEPVFERGSPNLLVHDRHDFEGDEHVRALVRAKREQIPVPAAMVERVEMRNAVGSHAAGIGKMRSWSASQRRRLFGM
jgi:hypothetical protein